MAFDLGRVELDAETRALGQAHPTARGERRIFHEMELLGHVVASQSPALCPFGEHVIYDVVFFGSWLSHVPRDRRVAFWSLIEACLKPAGRVFFVDDAFRPPEELIEGEASTTVQRRTGQGEAYRIVKVPYRPAELEQELAALGWRFTVTPTSGIFYWASGARARAPTRSG